jgi:hypothetical protein
LYQPHDEGMIADEGEKSPKTPEKSALSARGRGLAGGHPSLPIKGTPVAPFHIKSQTLRQMQLEPMTALGVFDARVAETAPSSSDNETRARPRWRQSEVKRLIAAAEQAGLESYRVEIAPDGTISIVVGAPADTADEPAGYRNLSAP